MNKISNNLNLIYKLSRKDKVNEVFQKTKNIKKSSLNKEKNILKLRKIERYKNFNSEVLNMIINNMDNKNLLKLNPNETSLDNKSYKYNDFLYLNNSKNNITNSNKNTYMNNNNNTTSSLYQTQTKSSKTNEKKYLLIQPHSKKLSTIMNGLLFEENKNLKTNKYKIDKCIETEDINEINENDKNKKLDLFKHYPVTLDRENYLYNLKRRNLYSRNQHHYFYNMNKNMSCSNFKAKNDEINLLTKNEKIQYATKNENYEKYLISKEDFKDNQNSLNNINKTHYKLSSLDSDQFLRKIADEKKIKKINEKGFKKRVMNYKKNVYKTIYNFDEEGHKFFNKTILCKENNNINSNIYKNINNNYINTKNNSTINITNNNNYNNNKGSHEKYIYRIKNYNFKIKNLFKTDFSYGVNTNDLEKKQNYFLKKYLKNKKENRKNYQCHIINFNTRELGFNETLNKSMSLSKNNQSAENQFDYFYKKLENESQKGKEKDKDKRSVSIKTIHLLLPINYNKEINQNKVEIILHNKNKSLKVQNASTSNIFKAKEYFLNSKEVVINNPIIRNKLASSLKDFNLQNA